MSSHTKVITDNGHRKRMVSLKFEDADIGPDKSLEIEELLEPLFDVFVGPDSELVRGKARIAVRVGVLAIIFEYYQRGDSRTEVEKLVASDSEAVAAHVFHVLPALLADE